MNLEQLTASSAADLWSRGGMPANESAAARAVARNAENFVRGRVRFPILDQAETAALFADDDDGLSGLGSFLKKAVKSVGKVVGTVGKTVAPALSVIPGVGPIAAAGVGGISSLVAGDNRHEILAATVGGGTGGVVQVPTQVQAKPLVLPADGGVPYMIPVQVPPQAPEKEVLGIPEKYLPWILAGFAVLLLRR